MSGAAGQSGRANTLQLSIAPKPLCTNCDTRHHPNSKFKLFCEHCKGKCVCLKVKSKFCEVWVYMGLGLRV